MPMLTKADDYPIHQTPEPIAYSGTDRNFYDRYFFNGYNPDGDLFFAAALGVYPHLNIMDASFCVVHDGVQHNLHASKHLKMERLDTQVGGIGVEVIEPLKCLALTCNDKDHGLQADLRFTSRHTPVEEPRFTHRTGARVGMDATRMTQNGIYQGWIEIKGNRFEISPDLFSGTRDRSWGIRPVGARDTQPDPDQGLPQFYWIWAPINYDNYCTYYHANTNDTGEAWNTSAVLIDLAHPDRHIKMATQASTIPLTKGTRHADHASIDCSDASGEAYRVLLKPSFNFYMKGLGYTHPEWAHGLNHGELACAYEEYVLADTVAAEVQNFHIQAFCQAELQTPTSIHHGRGILEQLIIGPHTPSGLKDMLDMAR